MESLRIKVDGESYNNPNSFAYIEKKSDILLKSSSKCLQDAMVISIYFNLSLFNVLVEFGGSSSKFSSFDSKLRMPWA